MNKLSIKKIKNNYYKQFIDPLEMDVRVNYDDYDNNFSVYKNNHLLCKFSDNSDTICCFYTREWYSIIRSLLSDYNIDWGLPVNFRIKKYENEFLDLVRYMLAHYIDISKYRINVNEVLLYIEPYWNYDGYKN